MNHRRTAPSGDVLHTDGKKIRLTTAVGETQELAEDHLVERVVLLLERDASPNRAETGG